MVWTAPGRAPDQHDGARHTTNEVTMPRFLTLTDVAETLNVSMSQARAMVRSGELPAIQVGGRGQWRIEQTVLEEFIADQYAATRRKVEQWAKEDQQA